MNKKHLIVSKISLQFILNTLSALSIERAKNSSKNAKFELTDVIVALLHQVAS
jgi:hypothetical protein